MEKKERQQSSTHFDAQFLRKVHSQSISSIFDKEIVFPEDDSVLMRCIYCGFGTLSEKSEWVQCDQCREWIHQCCDPENIDGNKSYSGSFVCQICYNHQTPHINLKQVAKMELRKKCTETLQKLNLSEKEREDLAYETITQRLSALWYKERKIRITSSFFDPICKAKNSSYVNILTF